MVVAAGACGAMEPGAVWYSVGTLILIGDAVSDVRVGVRERRDNNAPT